MPAEMGPQLVTCMAETGKILIGDGARSNGTRGSSLSVNFARGSRVSVFDGRTCDDAVQYLLGSRASAMTGNHGAAVGNFSLKGAGR